jgi:hypothetical protein
MKMTQIAQLLPEAESLANQQQYVYAIIGAYIASSMCWAVMFSINLKWGTKNSFSGLGLSLIWLLFSYRNYRFSIAKGHMLDPEDLQLNCECSILVLACSVAMVCVYIKHINNFIRRAFNKS